MTKKSKQPDHFQMEWHGNCVVVIPSANIEHLSWDVIDGAAQMVMDPLQKTQAPTMVFDLSVTSLDTLWPIYDTREEALADLEI